MSRVGLLLAVALVTITTWPIRSLVPATGLDPSWQAGLQLAADQGLDFGRQVVFTYGPLGFLAEVRLYVGWEAALGLVFNAVVSGALAAMLIRSLRDRIGLPLAVVTSIAALSIAALPIGGLGDRPAVATAIACLLLIERPASAPRWSAAILGGAIAIALLVKFTAIALIPLGIVGVWRLRPGRWRSLAQFAGGFLGCFVVLWLVTGNDLRDTASWVGDSVSVASGFEGALYLDGADRGWELPIALCLMALLVTAAWKRNAATGRAQQIIVAGGTMFVWWILFKQGFVRHDQHSFLFFSMIPIIALVSFRGGRGELVSAFAAVIALVTVLGAYRIDVRDAIDPISRAKAVVAQLGDTLIPQRRHTVQTTARNTMTSALGLDASVIRRIGRSTVQILPFELSAAWVFNLNWLPTPILQDYSAYTPRLVTRNASFLASPNAPEYILVHSSAGSSEFAQWSPETVVAINCNYRPDRSVPNWLLLRKSPGRCGPEQRIYDTTAPAEKAVIVPAGLDPKDMLIVRVKLQPESVWDRLRALVYRSAKSPPQLLFNDGSALRLVPSLADHPHLVRAPTDPSSTGVAIASANVETVAVRGTSGPVNIVFSRIRLIR